MIKLALVINVSKEIRIKTPMLRADLCDFSDAYIVLKGNITAKKMKTEVMMGIANNSFLKILLRLSNAFQR